MHLHSGPGKAAPWRRAAVCAVLVLCAAALLPGQALAASRKHHHDRTAPHARGATRKKAAHHHDGADLQSQRQSAQRSLATVQSSIRNTQQAIQLSEAERAAKENEVRDAELRIGTLNKQLRSTETEVTARQRALQQLATQRAAHEAARDQQLEQLRLDVQLGYRRGQDDYFKLLLNQQDPATVSRLLKYYSYIQQERSDRIIALNQTLTELAAIEAKQKDELDRLGVLQASLQQQHRELAQAQQSRQKAISVLNARIESADEKLKRLLSDQSNLQGLMQRLEQQSRDQAAREEQERAAREQARQAAPPAASAPPRAAPEEHWTSTPDYSTGGAHCALPVTGTVQSSFGSPRAGGLRWNGVLIGTAAGTPVHAVKAGRVVYADYLRGYGFLIILDHGHGLMSLYGQNQTLLKGVGDSVGAGDTIAQVGSSGGNSSPGLYFEIRVKGRPSNPYGWCSD